jgi:hypothetical protein
MCVHTNGVIHELWHPYRVMRRVRHKICGRAPFVTPSALAVVFVALRDGGQEGARCAPSLKRLSQPLQTSKAFGAGF